MSFSLTPLPALCTTTTTSIITVQLFDSKTQTNSYSSLCPAVHYPKRNLLLVSLVCPFFSGVIYVSK